MSFFQIWDTKPLIHREQEHESSKFMFLDFWSIASCEQASKQFHKLFYNIAWAVVSLTQERTSFGHTIKIG